MMRLRSGIAALSLLLPSVAAWGRKYSSMRTEDIAAHSTMPQRACNSVLITDLTALGHRTVAYLASNFVEKETAAYFKCLLNDTTEDYLASVATWADEIKDYPGHPFEWTKVFHFIDAHDSPPKNCYVRSTDCKETGCVISAISNYTFRSLDTSLGKEERIQAAKFLVHFIGDLHQPLHTEDAKRGGNNISVHWNGSRSNLHSVWDSGILEQMLGHDQKKLNHTAQDWASKLTTEIQSKNGIYFNESKSWCNGTSLTNPNITTMDWANEVNSYVCSYVLPNGTHDIIFGQDLYRGEYAKSAEPIVSTLIARAGYRLAKWLDLIAEKMPKPPQCASVGGEL